MEPNFQFVVLSRSWGAIHPQPKGVVLWLGGAFFGTFPTIFYRYLLRNIFFAKYTVVALPYWLTLNHWFVAKRLFLEQKQLPSVLIQEAARRGYSTEVYQDLTKYRWAGHSLGCEYITLLHFLSQDKSQQKEILKQCQTNLISAQAVSQNLRSLEQLDLKFSVENQPALLIAPCFKAPFFIEPLIQPKQQLTRCLLRNTSLVASIAMISFEKDFTAGNLKHQNGDVYWIEQNLKGKGLVLDREINGNHYQPLGYAQGNSKLAFNAVDFLNRLP